MVSNNNVLQCIFTWQQEISVSDQKNLMFPFSTCIFGSSRTSLQSVWLLVVLQWCPSAPSILRACPADGRLSSCPKSSGKVQGYSEPWTAALQVRYIEGKKTSLNRSMQIKIYKNFLLILTNTIYRHFSVIHMLL